MTEGYFGPISDQAAVTEAEFVAHYGDYDTRSTGDMALTLNQALQFEDAFCPADEAQRKDPAKRLRRLATMIGEQSLLPEHRWLCAAEES